MSEKNTVDFNEYAKKFGKMPNANKSGIRGELSRRSFPKEWKDICLQILLNIKEAERKALGHKRRGWGDLRDRIMADFDAVHVEGFDPRLTRQHMEHWENGKGLSDDRFRFVDRFITILDHPGEEVRVSSDIIEARDRYHAQVISDIYQVRRYDLDTVRLIKWVGDHGLISDRIANSWFQYIAIKFGIEESGVLKAIIAYCDFDIHDEKAFDTKRLLFNELFIVPVTYFVLKEDLIPELQNFGFEVFTRNCLLFQYRPQFQGELYRGYAAGELQYTFSNMFTHNDKFQVTVFLDHPNTSISPSINLDLRQNRYLNRVDPIQEEYLEGFEFDEKGNVKKAASYYSGEKHRYKYRLSPQSQPSENLDRIFETSYRGFLF